MRKFIISGIIVLCIVFIILISRIFIGNMTSGSIMNCRINYAGFNDFVNNRDMFQDDNSSMHMPQNNVDELYNNPEKYSGYSLDITIKNNSHRTLYIDAAKVRCNNRNIWFDESSLFMDVIKLDPGELHEGSIFFFAKTSNISSEQLEQIIKTIKIDIYDQIWPLPPINIKVGTITDFDNNFYFSFNK